jgi:hypothetical protein
VLDAPRVRPTLAPPRPHPPPPPPRADLPLVSVGNRSVEEEVASSGRAFTSSWALPLQGVAVTSRRGRTASGTLNRDQSLTRTWKLRNTAPTAVPLPLDAAVALVGVIGTTTRWLLPMDTQVQSGRELELVASRQQTGGRCATTAATTHAQTTQRAARRRHPAGLSTPPAVMTVQPRRERQRGNPARPRGSEIAIVDRLRRCDDPASPATTRPAVLAPCVWGQNARQRRRCRATAGETAARRQLAVRWPQRVTCAQDNRPRPQTAGKAQSCAKSRRDRRFGLFTA